MRDSLATVLFYAINVVLFPVTLAGYVIWVGKMLVTGRGSGVSGTAQGPLMARWSMHRLGTRSDEPADRLLPIVPGISPLALRLTTGPVLLGHRLTGYVPRAFRYPFQGEVPRQYQAAARVPFYDQIVERCLREMRQLVLLGAGYDTRPYRLPRDSGVRSFEVDTPRTQAVKRQVLAQAGIDAGGVTFVPADFERDDWLQRLADAGFDPTRPALFLWEGVTIYLDRAAVEDTLRKIAGTAPGSVVAFDYFTTEALTSGDLYWRYGRWATRMAGEPIKFGVDSSPPSRERLAELLRSCGLELGEQRTLGDEGGGRRAWGGFATGVVPAAGAVAAPPTATASA